MPELRIPRGRARLAAVLQAVGDVVHIDDASSVLNISRVKAAKLLSRWAGQGWLRRVGKGAYVPVQLDSLDSAQVIQDPWVLVPALFAPAYIGGRTAAEHWDSDRADFSRHRCLHNAPHEKSVCRTAKRGLYAQANARKPAAIPTSPSGPRIPWGSVIRVS